MNLRRITATAILAISCGCATAEREPGQTPIFLSELKALKRQSKVSKVIAGAGASGAVPTDNDLDSAREACEGAQTNLTKRYRADDRWGRRLNWGALALAAVAGGITAYQAAANPEDRSRGVIYTGAVLAGLTAADTIVIAGINSDRTESDSSLAKIDQALNQAFSINQTLANDRDQLNEAESTLRVAQESVTTAQAQLAAAKKANDAAATAQATADIQKAQGEVTLAKAAVNGAQQSMRANFTVMNTQLSSVKRVCSLH